MLILSIVILIIAFSIPAIRKSNYEVREAKKTDQQRFDELLEHMRGYDWDSVRIGDYILANPTHYYEALETIYQIERGIFPATDMDCDASGKPDAYHRRSFNLYDVEEYIRLRKSWEDHVRRGPFRGYNIQIDRLYNDEFREGLRNGQIRIDGKMIPLSDAKSYMFNKVSDQMEKVYHFRMQEPDWNTQEAKQPEKIK